jgi:ubiquinone/menaquinone biosynthesis C-methylase UbiE
MFNYEPKVKTKTKVKGLPTYLTQPFRFSGGCFKYWILRVIFLAIYCITKIALSPRKESVGTLDTEEVSRVYDREARSYDTKHHLTTKGMDTTWRRLAGWAVLTVARQQNWDPRVLDLCTGTGLTISEITTVLSEWGVQAKVIGFDYNGRMLELARQRQYDPAQEISFVQGDATKLSEVGFEQSFDVVTQMCGIGGIADPVSVFQGVLEVLRSGGRYFISDMHQPIPKQPGEISLLWRWIHSPTLERIIYEEGTIPLVLNRLWGWRDTTLDFYLVPLITITDDDGNNWGFKVVDFEVQSHRWWLGLPLMPVAKLVVEKEQITKEESRIRQRILDSLL